MADIEDILAENLKSTVTGMQTSVLAGYTASLFLLALAVQEQLEAATVQTSQEKAPGVTIPFLIFRLKYI